MIEEANFSLFALFESNYKEFPPNISLIC